VVVKPESQIDSFHLQEMITLKKLLPHLYKLRAMAGRPDHQPVSSTVSMRSPMNPKITVHIGTVIIAETADYNKPNPHTWQSN